MYFVYMAAEKGRADSMWFAALKATLTHIYMNMIRPLAFIS